MKIAIYHNLPSGGAKRTLLEQTKRLVLHHCVDVFTLSTADSEFADIQPFVAEHHVLTYKPLPLLRSPFGRVNQLVRIAELQRLRSVSKLVAQRIARCDYDVVYVEPCQYTNSPGILRYLRSPSVLYAHETLRGVYDPPVQLGGRKTPAVRGILDKVDPLPAVYRALLAREDAQNLRSARLVLANSEFSRQNLVKTYGIRPELCYHGVDHTLFRPLALIKEPFVLSVGALRPNKGFEFVIESLGLIPSSVRPPLVIASNHENSLVRSRIEQLARLMSVQLKVLPRISDEALVALYNRAVLTVYAPHREPFGLVPLESMSCGTPVVGVNEGGLRETVLDGVTGRLVERDQTQFAATVQQLLQDSEQRKLLGRQAMEYVERMWSWDVSTRNLEKWLTETAILGKN